MKYCRHCDEYYEGDVASHLLVCDSPSYRWEESYDDFNDEDSLDDCISDGNRFTGIDGYGSL